MVYKNLVLGFVLAGVCAACSSNPKQELKTGTPAKKFESGFVDTNGLKMYYEIHGEGSPLVLLHGGGSSIDVTYGKGIPELAKSHRVIAFDEQGHGRSGDRDQALSFEQTADDIAKALEILKVEKADVMGFSNGGNVAMQIAIRHPQKVRKLIVSSVFFKRSGLPKTFWQYMKNASLKDMPKDLQDAFLKVNTDPEKLKRMHDLDAARMNAFKDWKPSVLKSIKSPSLVMAGDHDIMTVEHTVEIARTIPGARLFILPGGHDNYLGDLTSAKPESLLPKASLAVIEEFLRD